MQIHVREEYGTHGPYSLEQLQGLIDKGRVLRNDVVWVEGTEDWVPLDQVTGIIVREAPIADSAPIDKGPQVRPWVRFWARSIDGWLAIFLLAVPIGYFLPENWEHRLVS